MKIRVKYRLHTGKFSYFVTEWRDVPDVTLQAIASHIEKSWQKVRNTNSVYITHLTILEKIA